MELCATCKEAREKCKKEYCVLEPYLPVNKAEKYACLSKVFDVRRVVEVMKDIDPSQRQACVASFCFEAEIRLWDPIRGSVGVIRFLQRQLEDLNLMLEIDKTILTYLQAHRQNHQHPIRRSRL